MDTCPDACAGGRPLRCGLCYLRRGLSIIPVHKRSKSPLLRWGEFQKRRPTEDEVRRWLRQWPDANVAIVTGAVSGVVVLDIDGMTDLDIPTLRVRTRKGWHLYFRHPGFPVPNGVRKLPDVDIRGDGGYVIAPPSVHPSGHVYTWEWAPLAPLPDWLVELLRPKPRPPVVIPESEAYADAVLRHALDELAAAQPGTRNDTLNRVAFRLGKFVAAGRLNRAMVEHLLTSVALSLGLDQREIFYTIRSGLDDGAQC